MDLEQKLSCFRIMCEQRNERQKKEREQTHEAPDEMKQAEKKRRFSTLMSSLLRDGLTDPCDHPIYDVIESETIPFDGNKYTLTCTMSLKKNGADPRKKASSIYRPTYRNVKFAVPALKRPPIGMSTMEELKLPPPADTSNVADEVRHCTISKRTPQDAFVPFIPISLKAIHCKDTKKVSVKIVPPKEKKVWFLPMSNIVSPLRVLDCEKHGNDKQEDALKTEK